MSIMQDLAGKNAVVTGGGSGIGRGIALALAEKGVNVVISDVRGKAAEAVAKELASIGVKARAVQTDVTDPDAVAALAEQAYEAFGAIHILVNSAGVMLLRPLEQATADDGYWMMAVNFHGIVECCGAFVPRMKAQGEPAHIVNNASMAALIAQPIPGLGLYNATKHACLGYTESLKHELAGQGISVSLLCPGRIDTDLGKNTQDFLASKGVELEPPAGPPPRAAGATPPAAQKSMTPEECGEIVVRAIVDDRFIILTHPSRKHQVEERYRAILADIDAEARAQAQEGGGVN